MTTAYDKYKEYQEEVTPQEYEADEKEYLAKIKKFESLGVSVYPNFECTFIRFGSTERPRNY